MRALTWAWILAATAGLAGCSRAAATGSGKIVSESRSVAGFSAVDFRGDEQLIIERTGTESLTITGDDNLLPYITSEVRGGRLVLEHKDRVNLAPSRPMIFKLTVKDLDQLDMAGDGSVDARGIQSDCLKISQTGDGKMKIAGTAESQDLLFTGDGEYHGEDLNAKAANVRITGDGRAVLKVSDKLDVHIIGDGSVEYIGEPAVTQSITGDGAVRKR